MNQLDKEELHDANLLKKAALNFDIDEEQKSIQEMVDHSNLPPNGIISLSKFVIDHPNQAWKQEDTYDSKFQIFKRVWY